MRDLRKDSPTAQLTALGWTLSGPIGNEVISSEPSAITHCVSESDTNSLLQRFWEDEEVSHNCV